MAQDVTSPDANLLRALTHALARGRVAMRALQPRPLQRVTLRGQAAAGEEWVRAAAEALDCRADLRLAGPLLAVGAGLRTAVGDAGRLALCRLGRTYRRKAVRQ